MRLDKETSVTACGLAGDGWAPSAQQKHVRQHACLQYRVPEPLAGMLSNVRDPCTIVNDRTRLAVSSTRVLNGAGRRYRAQCDSCTGAARRRTPGPRTLHEGPIQPRGKVIRNRSRTTALTLRTTIECHTGFSRTTTDASRCNRTPSGRHARVHALDVVCRAAIPSFGSHLRRYP